MPTRPTPKVYSCTSCGWSKRSAPQSDCFLPGDHFNSCPKCSSSVVVTEDKITALTDTLKRLIGLKSW